MHEEQFNGLIKCHTTSVEGFLDSNISIQTDARRRLFDHVDVTLTKTKTTPFFLKIFTVLLRQKRHR